MRTKNQKYCFHYPSNECIESNRIESNHLTTLSHAPFLIPRSHCKSLVNVNIPRTVKQIPKGCFDGCGQLMSVELSPSLNFIGKYAFHMCDKLRVVYHENYLGNHGAFFSCADLQVVVGHQLPDNDNTDDYLDEGERETKWNLLICKMVGERFENLPLHRLCYKQACESAKNQVTHQERINNQIQQNILDNDDNTNDDTNPMDDHLVDPYGMNAFHLLALSVRPNIRLFQKLQPVHPRRALTMHDAWKTMPLEYLLCFNRAPGTVEMLQAMMEWGFQSRIQFLGLVQWKQEVQFEMDGLVADFGNTTNTTATATATALTTTQQQRRDQLHQFLLKLLHYERLEALSVLECALWKSKLQQQPATTMSAGSTNDYVPSFVVQHGGEERSLCRFRCGADVVIVNVLSLLGPVMLPSRQ